MDIWDEKWGREGSVTFVWGNGDEIVSFKVSHNFECCYFILIRLRCKTLDAPNEERIFDWL